MSLFSSSEEAVLSRQLDVRSSDEAEIIDMDISGTAEHIVHGGYQRVALQFPDAELSHAEPVLHQLQDAVRALETERGSDSEHRQVAELFVLADTSFDGFQLDFVAAQVRSESSRAIALH